jgi:hypothetical protein
VDERIDTLLSAAQNLPKSAARKQFMPERSLPMAKKLVLGTVLGAIVLFVWSALSWMVLPWHKATLHRLADGAAVAQAVAANASGSGVYAYPAEDDPDAEAKMISGPFVFIAYHTGGMTSMTAPMGKHFVSLLVVAFLATWLVSKTSLPYGGRILFITVMGFAASVFCILPNWTWMGFDSSYVMAGMADTTIGAFLSALVIAKVAPR